MRPIPRDPSVESSFSFSREGFLFISNRCRTLGSDIFEAKRRSPPSHRTGGVVIQCRSMVSAGRRVVRRGQRVAVSRCLPLGRHSPARTRGGCADAAARGHHRGGIQRWTSLLAGDRCSRSCRSLARGNDRKHSCTCWKHGHEYARRGRCDVSRCRRCIPATARRGGRTPQPIAAHRRDLALRGVCGACFAQKPRMAPWAGARRRGAFLGVCAGGSSLLSHGSVRHCPCDTRLRLEWVPISGPTSGRVGSLWHESPRAPMAESRSIRSPTILEP